jgi:hypothetical protein
MSVNVIYPNYAGGRFDTSYYPSTHIPLAMKVMSAASVILTIRSAFPRTGP